MKKSELKKLYRFNPPQGISISKSEKIRKAALLFAEVVNNVTPDCGKKVEALKKIGDTVTAAYDALASGGE